MGEVVTSALVLDVILEPILRKFENNDLATCHSLRAIYSSLEIYFPGFFYGLLLQIIEKTDLKVNINEVVLRLQNYTSIVENERFAQCEEPFQELNKKSLALKTILSRIPDEIGDRKIFLETIKEIASAIKKLLDVVNEVCLVLPHLSEKQAIEQKKKEFVKFSKKFSTTLKEYFKEGHSNAVFISALHLIRQTNQIMVTVNGRSD